MFLGQEMHSHMVHIAYYTEFNLQVCNYAQKRRKIANARLTKTFVAIFALAERLSTYATLRKGIFAHTPLTDIFAILTKLLSYIKCQIVTPMSAK